MSDKQQLENLRHQVSEIFLSFRSYVRYIALMNAPDDHLADDIVQEVYIAFTEDPTRWDLKRDPRPLLRGITLNIAKKHWDKYVRTLPEHLTLLAQRLQKGTSDHESTLELSIHDEEEYSLRVCIDKLTQKSRILIERHYYDDVSLVDIAEESGVNINTLYYQINQIRVVLKKCVEKVLGIKVHHA